jgi:hypothetical protein
MTQNDLALRSRYLATELSSDGVILTFEPAQDLTLGSRRRAKEARHCVTSLLSRRRIKAAVRGDTVCATGGHACGW